MRAFTRTKNVQGDVTPSVADLDRIAGVAPKTQLISLKVLDESGKGKVSSILDALAYVQQVNDHGKWDHVDGVNLSVGYEFDAEWFACGKSPLCIEVDRLVGSGVVVVTAAGNTGYGFAQTAAKGAVKAGIDLTINDPGNAELAITVGSTHRKEPHTYGVSYFSSKGPTGDGRLKPDLLAPGERVISCATGGLKRDMQRRSDDGGEFLYVENSGTSMAAPHVSGAVAAFLSIRSEFKSQPGKVKEIFMSTATDLGRDRYFQGQGLIDLMSRPSVLEMSTGGGAADLGGAADVGGIVGDAALFGGLIGGIKKAASDFPNTLTYYTMKQRSGNVGEGGANSLLLRMQFGRRSHRHDGNVNRVGSSASRCRG